MLRNFQTVSLGTLVNKGKHSGATTEASSRFIASCCNPERVNAGRRRAHANVRYVRCHTIA